MTTLYLCGPINGCTDAEAINWREHVKTIWPGTTLDPMRRDYRGKEAECVDEIVELDKIDIARSDALVVNYDKPSVGTSMEVYLAFTTGKGVVVVARPDAVISPWLRYHSHSIVHSFDDAVLVLKTMFA
ncbi:hypothetical protein IP68_12575 [Blastomonas sp. AAP25]|uniref:hypothetical protein n=1 Tax=Blastomonas sp. AAP25 TaxID=1523416 RepID=UPI0006B9D06F|nr:hypothetical protein [Blastomonas sp. AAP25]KPF74587.1 hypothetical protein IP68_12575 [Blastomonas sp. AAP25]